VRVAVETVAVARREGGVGVGLGLGLGEGGKGNDCVARGAVVGG
jgi:hypothetical protein